jgi:hypothetical protein
MIARLSAFVICLAVPGVLAAQAPATSPSPAFDSVQVAWDEGRYPEALTRLGRLLAGPEGERHRRAAALLTGELYPTREVVPDGRRVLWSPDGRWAVVEVGVPLNPMPAPPPAAARSVVLRLDGDSLVRVRELPGAATAFLGAGRLAWLRPGDPAVRVLDLSSLAERSWPVPAGTPVSLADARDGRVLVLARTSPGLGALYALGEGRTDTLVDDITRPVLHGASGDGSIIVYQRGDTLMVAGADWGRVIPGVTGAAIGGPNNSLLAVTVASPNAPASLTLTSLTDRNAPVRVLAAGPQLGAPAISPDGRWVAYQKMLREDWELFVVDAAGRREERRLTREVQHDLLPAWLTNERLLGKMGEARHRRGHIIDVTSLERTRLFHNNTLRTVSMEYAWAPSPDGARVLVVADRDGNTISPERAVYLTDLTREVTLEAVQARVAAMLAAELELRARGTRAFAPIAAAVRQALADVSVARIDRYAHDLYLFDSKYIGTPGNARAIEYLAGRLRAWGYEPELQWFEPRRGMRTANVVATLRGTVNPELVYVVSSHFDSEEVSPGADDNSSGTTALLEAARVLAGRPQAATIQFAFFTAEEAGLLGSREFVRRAVADSVRLVGALNNDMVGFMNDHRLDNTIRYSNDGIRDLQHAAAFLFTRLVTYDSRYYQSTDAHAYYEAYGDIVGGIGSYPILGNPHYHQSHDALETIGQELVAEVSKTTVATLMLLASSPSRLRGLTVEASAAGATATWTAARETGVRRYVVTYGPPDDPGRRTLTVLAPRAVLTGAQPGWHVAVKAVNARGLEGWDWARAVVPAR